MKPEVRQSVRLIAVVSAVGLAAAFTSIALLYNVAMHQHGLRLQGMAQNHAHLIEAIAARYARVGDTDVSAERDSALAATIARLRADRQGVIGIGRTGELTVGRRNRDSIVFVYVQREDSIAHPAPIPFDGKLAAPMYRALIGQSGIGILSDYRGTKVLAAYEPVEVFGLGVVAKVNVADVQTPYVNAGILVLAATILLVIGGGLLLLLVTAPARRRLREAEESQVLLDGVLKHMGEGAYLIRVADGVIVQTNSKFDEMFGSVPGEIVGKNVSVVNAPTEKKPEEVAQEIVAELNRSRRWTGEVLNVRKDGTTFWCDAVVTTLDHPRFGPVWLSMHRDITERKQAEREKERLAREVELKNVELEQLIFAASHDLRTPLVGVQGFVGELHLSLKDLLAELDQPDVPPAFRERITGLTHSDIPESLKFIDAGVTRMGALLSGLLRLSRLGRAAFRAETLDMNRIVGEVVRSLEFAVREAGAKVEVADLTTALSDPMQVGQVFANLIENALKYRSPDRDPVISITGRREGATAVYCVEDNGIGIEPEQQERIFTPFFRVDASVTGGEGLGLTIVTRIVERLGGRVWVESELGKGSRFYVALPAAEEEPRIAKREA